MKQITTNTVELTPVQSRDIWCIYSHSIPPYTDIFYLGVCKLRDIHDFTEAYRNTYWRSVIKEETPIRVTLLGTSESLIECQKHQRTLFNTFRPIANVKGHVISGKSLVTCTVGPNAGVTYASQLEAAERNGITPGALSNHLSGRTGYEHIRGMKFVRGGGVA